MVAIMTVNITVIITATMTALGRLRAIYSIGTERASLARRY